MTWYEGDRSPFVGQRFTNFIDKRGSVFKKRRSQLKPLVKKNGMYLHVRLIYVYQIDFYFRQKIGMGGFNEYKNVFWKRKCLYNGGATRIQISSKFGFQL